VPADGVPVDFYTQRLRAHIDVLARRAAIAHDDATALFDLAMAHAPAGTSAAGVVHRDLCPENIVRRPSGALCVIDLESAAIGAGAYDLARTWYRWPMAPEHRAALFTAYTDHGGVAPVAALPVLGALRRHRERRRARRSPKSPLRAAATVRAPAPARRQANAWPWS
jgi:aminoglycoside phosphotransferase (APT) family kinase protein